MDCVPCEKCKLNGKMQVRGLATAMKILFSSDELSVEDFTKTDIIALINFLERLSESLQIFEYFHDHAKHKSSQFEITKLYTALAVASVIGLFGILSDTKKKPSRQSSKPASTGKRDKLE